MALATVGIISIGDMGSGIAKLLVANNYRVITNASDRRSAIANTQATQERAKRFGVELVATDVDLCNTADYILSIVPPRDALATAHRIIRASSSSDFDKERPNPLYFLDLNATSPRLAREINDDFSQDAPHVPHIDGGIIGGPPRLKDDGTWYKPSIPLSGHFRLADASPSGDHLATVLNVKHLNTTIGAATGLKMCFASLHKGFFALAIQAYTTAYSLGVEEELEAQLHSMSPGTRSRAEGGLVSMPPKAYRWVNEMEQIAETFEADGGFTEEESSFRSIAQVYALIADGTKLGKEKTESRVRGTTPRDVAKLVYEGTERRKGEKIEC